MSPKEMVSWSKIATTYIAGLLKVNNLILSISGKTSESKLDVTVHQNTSSKK